MSYPQPRAEFLSCRRTSGREAKAETQGGEGGGGVRRGDTHQSVSSGTDWTRAIRAAVDTKCESLSSSKRTKQ